MDTQMPKPLKSGDHYGMSSEMTTARIPAARFDEIAQAGGIQLSVETKTAIEDALNSYIRHTSWDRNSRPSEETRRHSRSLVKHLDGLVHALGQVRRNSGNDGPEHNRTVALVNQCLFHRAGVSPTEFGESLQALKKQLDAPDMESTRGGRPKDLFLPDFFCELEEIFLKAGGEPVG